MTERDCSSTFCLSFSGTSDWRRLDLTCDQGGVIRVLPSGPTVAPYSLITVAAVCVNLTGSDWSVWGIDRSTTSSTKGHANKVAGEDSTRLPLIQKKWSHTFFIALLLLPLRLFVVFARRLLIPLNRVLMLLQPHLTSIYFPFYWPCRERLVPTCCALITPSVRDWLGLDGTRHFSFNLQFTVLVRCGLSWSGSQWLAQGGVLHVIQLLRP